MPVTLADVTDIKNVRNISSTRQLQAQVQLAKELELSFNLIISPNTKIITKPLWREIQRTGGTIFEYNPVAQKMIKRVVGGVKGNKVLR